MSERRPSGASSLANPKRIRAAKKTAQAPLDACLSIPGLHAAYAKGVSPAAVMERVFARIKAVNDPGIFITLQEQKELLEAAAALPPFDPSKFPLWGIPFAVKDNIDVAGMPTTCACPAFSYVPEKSAPAVEKLVDAGALCIGKTNLDQFATGLVGVRTPYPVPRNAIDPNLVPGGSSSGSAVAVAQGIVSFALGTDTAGSGRVPAALNNIVGLKPSGGVISSRGVVPACRTVDCVSVFAGTVDDAWRVFEVMAGYDAEEPYSRLDAIGVLSVLPPHPVLGVPKREDLRFFGDGEAAKAFDNALEIFGGMGVSFKEVDLRPFYEAAALLYDGPWVAERHAALRSFMDRHAEDMVPVTRRIIETAKRYSASDLFDAIYTLAGLRRATEPVWGEMAALVVPSIPRPLTVADVRDDPIGRNSELGTYTNFVNLLDLAALAIPGPARADKLPTGVTLIGPHGSDAGLASFGRVFLSACGSTIGATGLPMPPMEPVAVACPEGMIEIAVVGAHLSGMPLNGELLRSGGVFLRGAVTEPVYCLYALPGGAVPKPALVRTGSDGASIEVEVWALPAAEFGKFTAQIPPPLGMATLLLADGTAPKGFLGEAVAVSDAKDISSFGGWRAYVLSNEKSTKASGKPRARRKALA
ncbi:MAG: allophanate hydrolase [Rhodomicrobium sp.]